MTAADLDAVIVPARPFRSAEETWFWTMGHLLARRDGGSWSDRTPRPCAPDDVLRCVDQLYRLCRVELLHARVLRVWGERQTAPRLDRASERADARLWQEAMTRLDWKLRAKGVVQ